MGERVVWTYFLSRDSADGVVGDACKLWSAKPKRVRDGNRIAWVEGNKPYPGLLGVYPMQVLKDWFGVVSDTDMELVRVVQYPTKRMIDEANAQARATTK